MEIIKPKNLESGKQNKDKLITDINEEENINNYEFENVECNNIKISKIEFEYCKFNNISIQNSIIVKRGGKMQQVTIKVKYLKKFS